MADLKIGKVGRRNFSLPLRLLTETTAVLGIRGSGKSYTASVIVEGALENDVPTVIIDPTDVHWGLKSSAAGDKAGFPVVVLGGHHGDLPLEPGAGAGIADFAVEHRVPLVLSLRHLRKKQQRQLVTDFAEQLYHRKGEAEHRVPLAVVIDEASAFVPQRVGGAEARMVGAIEDLVRRGRAAGLGVVLIDQRPASVNKDVLTQLSTLVCHRITAPQDRKALDEWIRQHDSEGHRDAFLESLASLPTGQAYFWSPVLDVFERVAVRRRQTFDSSATPELGQEAAAPQALAEIDMGLLEEQLAETVQRAKDNDPKELRKRIAELERQLRDVERAAPDPDALEAARAEGRREAAAQARALLQQHESRATTLLRALDAATIALSNAAHVAGDGLAAAKAAIEADENPGRDIDTPEGPAEHRPATKGSRARAPRSGAGGRRRRSAAPSHETEQTDRLDDLPPRQQAILDALAKLEAIGLVSAERTVVAFLAGKSHTSGGFRNDVSSLRTSGFVDYPQDKHVQLTALGRTAARPVDVPTLRELHEQVERILAPRQWQLLEPLLHRYPHPMSREELADEVGKSATSGGFRNDVSRLSSLQLVAYPSPGEVAATDLLFPEGLR